MMAGRAALDGVGGRVADGIGHCVAHGGGRAEHLGRELGHPLLVLGAERLVPALKSAEPWPRAPR